METDPYRETLRHIGVLRTGHFELASKNHSDHYYDKDALLLRPKETNLIAGDLAKQVMALPGLSSNLPTAVLGADRVASLLTGALGYALFRCHCPGEVLTVSARTIRWLAVGANSAFRVTGPCFELHPTQVAALKGRNVLLVDDVSTSGRTMETLEKLARAAGAIPIAGCAIVDRGGLAALDLPTTSLIQDLETSQEICSLCKEGKIPLDRTLGRTAEYLRVQG